MGVQLIDFLEREGIISAEEGTRMKANKVYMGTCKVLIKANSKEYFSEFDNGEMMEIMKYFNRTYETNNEISSQLMYKIPGMFLLVINEDVNNQRENPIIEFRRNKEDKTLEHNTIIVRKCHKIIWSILHQFYPETIKSSIGSM